MTVVCSAPDEEVSFSDRGFRYGLFNRKTFFSKQAKLFPRDKPDYRDIKQGYTDLDCYFLAVVSAVAKTHPNKIMECFPEYVGKSVSQINEQFAKATKIKIRFYKVTTARPGDHAQYIPDGKVYITVDKSALRRKGAPWVRILEKAYAVYRIKNYDLGARKRYKESQKKFSSRVIDGLNGGMSECVMVTLTGEKSKCFFSGSDKERSKAKKFSGHYCQEALQLYEKIKKALASGKIVTASASRGIRLYRKGLFFCHAYSVIDAFEKNGFKFIVVRNPYANRSRIYKDSKGIMHSKTSISKNSNEKGKMHSKTYIPKNPDGRGISELELNNFYKNYREVECTV